MIRKCLFIILLVVCSGADAEIYKNTNQIVLENELFKKTIRFTENANAGPIQLSLSAKNGDNPKEILFSQTPFFECVINNHLLTAQDNLWCYDSHKTRKMPNGEELVVIFKAVQGDFKDLQLVLYQQIFPQTTFVREKIIFRTSGNKKFTLNKRNNKLYFKFPQYSLINNNIENATEIRIASWANELIDIDPQASSDERFVDRAYNDHNLAQNHMFHPAYSTIDLIENITKTVKGPINIVTGNNFSWITTYEHASQDNTRGMIKKDNDTNSHALRDGLQGIDGEFDFTLTDEHFQFLGIAQTLKSDRLNISVDILRGGYLDGEIIDSAHPYASVWTAGAFTNNNNQDDAKSLIRDYLYRCICEKPASRQPLFYYNTWGMQRKLSSQGQPIRGLMTQEKLLQEIQYAAELGVDIFVLDDGWEQAQGLWTPHNERLPNGLAPIKAELDKYGIKMGVWFSPMGIDSMTQRYKDHLDWVIKDSKGRPVKAQWGLPVFDFVGDFYDLFVDDCKKLIDQGVRFFKWDAINTFFSTLPNMRHGDDSYPPEELMARYEYLLPIYVTRAMQELTDYEPELIIEMDLTEARRVMTGLDVLSQGKYYWINNGASGYNDYSTYRAKSMRTIPNLFAGLVPLELFNYADYPHNDNNAQRYNVNTSLISGHGFWGALEFMTPKERKRVGAAVAKSKRVLPYISNIEPQVIGHVGASPEIYTMINKEKAAGQVIAFSGQALEYTHKAVLKGDNMLGVLDHSYTCQNDTLTLPFQFPMPEASREAFILPNNDTKISITSSTCRLRDIHLSEEHTLTFITGAPGEQIIHWLKKYGKPAITKDAPYSIEFMMDDGDYYIIKTTVPQANITVTLK